MFVTIYLETTVPLKRSREVIELGKRLVSQLSVEDDLLACWMAHDIAGHIKAAEEAPLETRPSTTSICAEAILRLWNHRGTFPERVRPLIEFDAIVSTLNSLDLDRRDFRYQPTALREAESASIDPETTAALNLAMGIDLTARKLVRDALNIAIERVASSTDPWVSLAQAAEADSGPDIELLRIVLSDQDKSNAVRHQRKTELSERIATLEAFTNAAFDWAAQLRQELADLEGSANIP
jgi:hypothetical protein